uniref:Uncharacterized protein n=1 Tax=Arundo donax TaxID=35708 RepID=A0A0A9H3R3_ARUDO
MTKCPEVSLFKGYISGILKGRCNLRHNTQVKEPNHVTISVRLK